MNNKYRENLQMSKISRTDEIFRHAALVSPIKYKSKIN